MRQRFMVTTALLAAIISTTVYAEDLNVLQPQPDGPEPSRMMADYLSRIAFDALDQREAAFEEIQTAEQIAEYQASMKAFFVRQLGGWPERTPLNPRVVGTLDKGDYRVEKIIFESRPHFYVTGLLFLPAERGPYPGVLMPCGHSRGGKDSEAYQKAAILLATNGLSCFLYDPIGQGERARLLKENGTAAYGPVMEHTVVGVGSIVVGLNTATYRIWDGIRAIDYLCGRDDIDADRIGCTGNSGGGTLTSYLMALDERIVCAAPSCYLVGFRTLIETSGAQDAEQNIYGQIVGGMDHADYLLMRAPRPTLMLCATKDFFRIDGVWSVYRQAKRFYGRMGLPERVGLVEAEEPHGFSKLLREGSVRWMRRWLLGIDDVVTEPQDVTVLTAEEIQCTPRGQVMLMEGARSVIDLNIERAERLAEQRRWLWNESPKEYCLQKVRETAGIRPLSELLRATDGLRATGGLPASEDTAERTVAAESMGELERPGYRIEKLIIRPEEGIQLPALAFVPERRDGPACLYLHGQGKQAEAGEGGAIEALVKAGHLVLAVDLRGIGETNVKGHSKAMNEQFGPWQEFFLAYMLEKTFVGMRAEDVLISAHFLRSYRSPGSPGSVRVIATGNCAVPALHAVALEPQLFASASIEDVPTWSQLLRTPREKGQLVNAIHGVLGVYDLDDLRRALPAAMIGLQ